MLYFYVPNSVRNQVLYIYKGKLQVQVESQYSFFLSAAKCFLNRDFCLYGDFLCTNQEIGQRQSVSYIEIISYIEISYIEILLYICTTGANFEGKNGFADATNQISTNLFATS